MRRPKDAVLAIYEARAFAAAALIVIGVATDILPVVPAILVLAAFPLALTVRRGLRAN